VETFPDGFRWGAATAAYQIEGAVAEDGRGPSIWDAFSHAPGRVANGDTGDVACDHYHRLDADLDLLAQLGVGAYRFSVAWPRIQPDGRGAPNPRGLAFYERLVDGLLARGIEPFLTLYHWDLPQALQERGGWLDRDTAGRFSDYAAVVHDRLGDRVRHWTTLNEPWCSAFLGHAAGVHAPGVADGAAALRAAHHLLLAHGMGVAAMRAGGRAGWETRCSIVLILAPAHPARDDHEGDRDAALHVDGLQNRLFLDALLEGRYPEDMAVLQADLGVDEAVREGDLGQIAEPLDELGVNYYFRNVVRSGVAADGPSPWVGLRDAAVVVPSGAETTAMGWEIHPEGLTEVLRMVHGRRPDLPLYVTENGSAWDDVVEEGGRVRDVHRIEYLRSHVAACAEAVRAGVDLRGYFAWSLLDNFEWAFGYAKRFGLVHVDYATQERRLKDSAHAYREIVAANGLA
jgi:beta-glucosidase